MYLQLYVFDSRYHNVLPLFLSKTESGLFLDN